MLSTKKRRRKHFSLPLLGYHAPTRSYNYYTISNYFFQQIYRIIFININ